MDRTGFLAQWQMDHMQVLLLLICLIDLQIACLIKKRTRRRLVGQFLAAAPGPLAARLHAMPA